MKKKLLIAVLFLGCSAFVFSQAHFQAKPILGILPFSGGARGDGETIATLFSFQNEIQNAFTVVPRTSAVDDILAEQRFQLSGYTDSDTIAELGRMLGADYVISGTIRRLGNRNLVIATIIHVKTFEQVAGYYRTYGTIGEVRGFLPSMSESMVASMLRRNTSQLPRLAIPPFTGNINADDAETLTQILAVEILNTGNYVVLPRISTMQAALREQKFQMQGFVSDEDMVVLGRAINADFVLSAGVHSLGDIHLFTAQILHVGDGHLLAGATRDYRVIGDGINRMSEIALLLTDSVGAEERIAALNRRNSRAALFSDPARFWSVGAFAGTSFAEPWLTGSLQATFAPLRYSFLRVGCDLGFISGVKGTDYFSVRPFAHYAFFLPFDALPLPITSGGWHIGAGVGYMMAKYRFDVFSINRRILAADFVTGINIGNVFDISYTLRTDLSRLNFSSNSFSHAISAGFTYRFQTRSRR